jgi:hypothetical protein
MTCGRPARRDRHVEATAGLSDEDLAAIEQAEMVPGLNHLNAELLTGKNAAD